MFKRQFTVSVKPGDSAEKVADVIGQIEDAEKITRFQHSFGPAKEKDPSVPPEYPTDEEAYAIYEDQSESSIMRTIAFFYAYHVKMNSGLTKQSFLEMGRFGNVDAFIILRNPGYKGEGWRYKLTMILRKWNLIEDLC